MVLVDKVGAMNVLNEIQSGKCVRNCKTGWLRRIRYALKSTTNPLNLSAIEKRTMENKIKGLPGVRNTTRKNVPIKSVVYRRTTCSIGKRATRKRTTRKKSVKKRRLSTTVRGIPNVKNVNK